MHSRPAVRIALLAAAALWLLPATLRAQGNPFVERREAVGVGLWYGIDRFSVEAPPDSASAEVKGYTDVLPGVMDGQGPAIGVSFAGFGLNIGYSTFEADIGKVADLNGNGIADTGDAYVISATRKNTSVSLLYQPVRGFYLGYGRDLGTMAFSQAPVGAAGVGDTRRISYQNDYYSFGFGIGFDPTRKKAAPIFAMYGKVPVKAGTFNGKGYGAGIGVFF